MALREGMLVVAAALAACTPVKRTPPPAAASHREAGSWRRSVSRLGTRILVGEVPPADGAWMSTPDEPEPTDEEHAAFYRGLADRLRALLRDEGLEDLERSAAAYVRGDFFGWREEELYAYGERFAVRPAALVRIVRLVQGYLREHRRWRVVLPLGEGPASAVVIYPGRIFHGPRELDEAALADVTRRYVEAQTQEHEEKRATERALFDTVAARLHGAVRRARDMGAAQLVATLRRHDAVLVWAVEPYDPEAAPEAPRLAIEPDAVDQEEFRLDANGNELAATASWADAVAVLRVWAFDDAGLRAVRVTRGRWSATWNLGE